MKTYFAKYLQVAESIEDDDFFLTPDGRISQCKQVLESLPATIMNYSGETWKENELKKVQLFLCSRDIQIGNLVFIPNQEEAGNVVDEEDLTYWKSKNSYKITGPISPQAVWVREGDEFGEDDIYPNSLKLIKAKGSSATPIVIKCPTCKTFH